ncbi:hypothetical protein ACSBR1_001226 [Camellia fascicularis]
MLLQPMLAWVLGAAVLAAATVAAAAETSSSCPTSCGAINITYPFGTKEGCYMEEHFHVFCDHSSDPHKLYLNTSEGSIEITDILLSAEETNYTFSSIDLANLQNRSMVPVVLDWAVGNQRCDEAKKNLTSFACKANSDFMILTMVLGIAAIAPRDTKGTLILLMVVQVTTTMLKAFNFFLALML